MADDMEALTQEIETQASIRREQIEEIVKERWTVEEIEAVFKRWKNGCAICMIRLKKEKEQVSD